jgi:hypothetical protein
MNELQPTITPVHLLASYAQGREDGFKSGVIFGVGALLVYRALRKKYKGVHVEFTRNGKN